MICTWAWPECQDLLEDMKVVVFLSLALLGLAAGLEDEWTMWKTRYGKQYDTATEEAFRRAIWVENYKKVELHNRAGEYSYELEMNGFADMVRCECVAQRRVAPARSIGTGDRSVA